MLKNILILSFITTIIYACSATKNMQQKTDYITVPDAKTKVLKGYIDRNVLNSDTAFKWFTNPTYPPNTNPAAIESFKANKDKFTMLVFGGTWCEDTHNLWPLFYSLVDKSGYDEKKITLVAVDRDKKSKDDIAEKYNVKNVPTFIVLQDGKEAGRVIEFGKYGAPDKELGEIVSNLK